MPPTGEVILPGAHVLLTLPSGLQKVLLINPDTTISLGKFGSFPSNALLYRPYNQTYDITSPTTLRQVPASELNASSLEPPTILDLPSTTMPTNRHTLDSPSTQTLTWTEIEALKANPTNSGQDLVDALISSHTAISQKTPFSLQKYTARKTSKFLRRFTVTPLTVPTLLTYLHATKEPHRFLELRPHHLSLLLSLSNTTYGSRTLLIDETGGLLVLSLASRLGLHPSSTSRSTLTLIHANEQANLSCLPFFGLDGNNAPPWLETLTWLQLLSPLPPALSENPRKRARADRLHALVDRVKQGGYDALVVVSHMAVPGILKALVPLVRPSGQVVVYTPFLQTAVEVADLYSSARRAAWVQKGVDAVGRGRRGGADGKGGEGGGQGDGEESVEKGDGEGAGEVDMETPNPTLLLAMTVHKIGVRRYQVLPGRTHPVMTSKGGAEGYVLHGTRVVPVEGRVDARGAFRSGKKRKVSEEAEV